MLHWLKFKIHDKMSLFPNIRNCDDLLNSCMSSLGKIWQVLHKWLVLFKIIDI